ncbi:hypothetical protein N7539_000598 [Penicillium diatomitis]|uniref:Uncharacterized protein n=1 Tax=Penicillium diatomitis TaxID=2819901 RepID=A0A9W9XLZ4_9EURO|nr:uncharacterized protein N7539_000598 [Penicillium diatomitis]KAJ5495482.1 hypothetical protein N7539_000598 [Penicillium diatomitis]
MNVATPTKVLPLMEVPGFRPRASQHFADCQMIWEQILPDHIWAEIPDAPWTPENPLSPRPATRSKPKASATPAPSDSVKQAPKYTATPTASVRDTPTREESTSTGIHSAAVAMATSGVAAQKAEIDAIITAQWPRRQPQSEWVYGAWVSGVAPWVAEDVGGMGCG